MTSPRKTKRRRSIRFSLYSLLIIPMISLVTLWAFAAQSTAAEAIHQRNIDTTNKIYGNAVQPMLLTLAQERQESVVWLSGGGTLPRTPMDAVRKKMDATIVAMNAAAKSGKFQDTLSAELKRRLADLIGKLNRISAVRGDVDSGSMTKLAAFNAYNDILDTHFRFIYLLVGDSKDQQAYQLTNVSRAMELAGREAALVGGVLVAGGRMTADERAAISKLVFERRYLESSAMSEFNRANGDPFRQVLAGTPTTSFNSVEDHIVATNTGKRLKLTPQAWQASVGTYLQQMNGALLKSRTVLSADSKNRSDATMLRLILVGGVGLVAILLTAILMLRFGRRISRDLLGLQGAARDLADQRLPGVVTRLKRGDDVDVVAEAPPLEVGKTAEVANVAAAFSTVQRTAIEAAVGQAELRKAVNGVFQNLARRNQSLLHRQLAMLDTLERKASDPDDLSDLFAIDHLTTRMRRHAEGLIILSGSTPGRGWRHPVGVLDVLRGSIGEIEDYARVEVVSTAEEGIVGAAVADVVHLLAELLENAVTFSPPNTAVEVDAGLVGRGFVVEIQDRGLGMNAEKLAGINRQLAQEPEFDLAGGEQLGLFVVGTLAHRHGINVTLQPNGYGGVTAIALLPHSLVVSPDKIGVAEQAPEHSGEYRAEHSGEHRVHQTGEYPAQSPAYATGAHSTGAHSTGAHSTGAHSMPTPPPPGQHGPAQHDPFKPPLNDPLSAPLQATAYDPLSASAHDPLSAPVPPASSAPAPPAPQSPQSTPYADASYGDAGTHAGTSGAAASAGTHAGMPRRVRRANLAPQLRDTGPQSAPDEEQQPAERQARSPERARSVMSSMQSGWRRGRASTPPPAPGSDEGER
ncbi:nitrate- and nitrite sensing domain-containing protein [Actinomadura barringtoniae]|uniref:histidine kinase n=1 Tax=Actinomadura barringtoniae TaxID=1427535 RepID=A0A939P634_9ACTN|nr:nitrate- and nitrite sensing domain-containing protein [Actinomadura barringtoniae]MBO2446096.1 nitrate- and nitrite sensing domain-containing protein [Actinomadura barringtoniae]